MPEGNDYHAIYMYDEVVLVVRSPHTSSRYLLDRDTKVRTVVNIYMLQKCKMISVAEVDVLTVIGNVPVILFDQFESWVLNYVCPDDKYRQRMRDIRNARKPRSQRPNLHHIDHGTR